MNDNEFIEGVMVKMESFYEDEDAETKNEFFQFADKHYEKFDEEFEVSYMESKLEFTDLYNEFCNMFEGHLMKFIEEVKPGATAEEFYTAVKNFDKSS